MLCVQGLDVCCGYAALGMNAPWTDKQAAIMPDVPHDDEHGIGTQS